MIATPKPTTSLIDQPTDALIDTLGAIEWRQHRRWRSA